MSRTIFIVISVATTPTAYSFHLILSSPSNNRSKPFFPSETPSTLKQESIKPPPFSLPGPCLPTATKKARNFDSIKDINVSQSAPQVGKNIMPETPTATTQPRGYVFATRTPALIRETHRREGGTRQLSASHTSAFAVLRVRE